MTNADRQDRERRHTLLLGLAALGLVVAYHVVPALLWGSP